MAEKSEKRNLKGNELKEKCIAAIREHQNYRNLVLGTAPKWLAILAG